MEDNKISSSNNHIKTNTFIEPDKYKSNTDYSFNNDYTIKKDKNGIENRFIEPETLDLTSTEFKDNSYKVADNSNTNTKKEEYLTQLNQIENTIKLYDSLNIEEIFNDYYKAKEELDSTLPTDPNYYQAYLNFSKKEEEYNDFIEKNASLIGVYRELKEYEKILPYLRKRTNDDYDSFINNYNSDEYSELIDLEQLFKETNKYNNVIDENDVYKSFSSYWENFNIEELKSKGYLDENNNFTGDYLTLVEGIMNKSNQNDETTIDRINYFYQNSELEKYIDAYQFLDDEEKELYHYLFKTEGKRSAEDYLSKLQDKINQAKGYKNAENLINRLSTDYDLRNEYLKLTEDYQKIKNELQTTPTMDASYPALLNKYKMSEEKYNEFMKEHPKFKDVENISLYDYLSDNLHVTIEGLGDGINQFNQGFTRVFISDGEISAEDYKTMYLSQYLSNDKVLSLNYKASTSTGNILPAILLSTIFSVGGLGSISVRGLGSLPEIAGNSIRTVSMFGNAQNEALLNGYTKEQARTYALLNSASESISEYFIGGIPGLSTKTANGEIHTLTDRLYNIITSSISEGYQEFLQTYIEAGVKSATLGEEFSITETSEEAIEAALIGFITSWNLNGSRFADIVINGKQYSIDVQNTLDYINNNPDSSIEEAIKKNNNPNSNINENNTSQNNQSSESITFDKRQDIASYFGDSNLYLYGMIHDKYINNQTQMTINQLFELKSKIYQGDTEAINSVKNYLTPEELQQYEKIKSSESDSIQSKWLAKLTDSEKFSIKDYAKYFGSIDANDALEMYNYDSNGNSYISITELMRAGLVDGNLNIDTAIEKFGTLPHEITTYRRVSEEALTSQFGAIDKNNLQSLVGKTYEDKAYMSTALLKNRAIAPVTDNANILLKIQVPTDSNYGAYIEKLSDLNYNQTEFLIKRNSTSIIENAYTDEKGNIVIEMKLFDNETTKKDNQNNNINGNNNKIVSFEWNQEDKINKFFDSDIGISEDEITNSLKGSSGLGGILSSIIYAKNNNNLTFSNDYKGIIEYYDNAIAEQKKFIEDLKSYYRKEGALESEIDALFSENNRAVIELNDIIKGKEAIKKFAENTEYGKFFANLTEDEISEIQSYTGFAYGHINKGLREVKGNTDKLTGNQSYNYSKTAVKNLDRVIEKAPPLKESIELHRGVDINAFTKGPLSDLFNDVKTIEELYATLKSLEGESLKEYGYMSTSLTTSGAKNNSDIQLEIIAPKGTKGVYLEPLTSTIREQEYLLKRDSSLKIVEVKSPTINESGKQQIIVKCIVEQ